MNFKFWTRLCMVATMLLIISCKKRDIVPSGKEADFIVLDRNIVELGAGQIRNTKVDLTYVKGKLVYER